MKMKNKKRERVCGLAQDAGAFFPRDKDMIFGAITAGVGFSVLNQKVKEKMRGSPVCVRVVRCCVYVVCAF